MCFFFFFIFPQLSPSFTISPSHSSPHTHGCFSGPPPKMVTSYLVPRCDLGTKVQRSRKRCGHARRCQPGLTGMRLPTGFFTSSGSPDPHLILLGHSSCSGALNHGKRDEVPGIGTMGDGVGSVLSQTPQTTS